MKIAKDIKFDKNGNVVLGTPTNENPTNCPFPDCNLSFTTPGGLKIHMGRKHQNSDSLKKDLEAATEKFTFPQYFEKKFKLSFIAGVFREATGTIEEWDAMLDLLILYVKHHQEKNNEE